MKSRETIILRNKTLLKDDKYYVILREERVYKKGIVKLHAIVEGTIKQINKILDLNVDDIHHTNHVLSGSLYIHESLIPFNKDEPESDIKMAGNLGIACTFKDKPIYRKAFYSKTIKNDILLNHDNHQEILDAWKKEKGE